MSLRKNIFKQLDEGTITQQEAVSLLKELQESSKEKNEDIAIIGMACRLPMSETVDEFWDNIKNGRNCFVSKPEDKLQFEQVFKNEYYAELFETEAYSEKNEKLEDIVGAFIEDIDKFDANFFNIPPREAKQIDPAQRVFLETAWSAIEDAGYSVNNIKDSMTGVFVGKDYSNSIHYKFITMPDPMKLTGTWEGILASRISYIFNFKGPAMVIDTACSSGLVAIHEACAALRNKECTMAIAGGLSIGAGGSSSDEADSGEVDDGALGAVTSNDNRVRTFDQKCSGSVFGEGIVTFLLKPYSDAVRDKDNIYAVIKGSAINNDGASNGITAPNPVAQEAVITEAWKRAGISPESVSYVEAHGTGTLLGDPIEIIGLTNAFAKQTSKKQFCGIGSVKTNIGHLVAASGCASLLKVVMSMQNGVLPPSIYFEEPNKHIDFLNSPVYVVDKLTEWNTGEASKIAGINAFGFSGTNCHVVVEEAPKIVKSLDNVFSNNIVTFSAKSETALFEIVQKYSTFLNKEQEIRFDDICYTANTGRGHYNFRIAIVASDKEELTSKIHAFLNNGNAANGLDGVYYGKHKVVSDKRSHKEEGEITESALRKITIEAQGLIERLSSDTDFDVETLNQLAFAYTSGASVEWNKLYDSKEFYRVSLPTYQFDKIECWGAPKVSNIKASATETTTATIHPLLDKLVVESLNQTIYSVQFNIDRHWMLKEHKIMGSNIVPGTTYIEIVKTVCEKYFSSSNILVKRLAFLSPLVVKDEDVEAHIILEKDKDQVKFTVASKNVDDSDEIKWTIHSEGIIGIHNSVVETQFDVADISNHGEEIFIPIPEEETSDLVYMGPRWHCIEHIYKEGDTLYSEIKLNEKFDDDLKYYNYHPSMADAALNIPIQVYVNQEMYLPMSYKNLRIFKDIPNHFYSRVEKIGGNTGTETLLFKVVLEDDNGQVIATVDEYVMKKVGKFNHYIANTFYDVKWHCEPENEIEKQKVELAGNTLVLLDSGETVRSFADRVAEQSNVYVMKIGDVYKKISDNEYIVNGTETDYEKFFEDTQITSLNQVYHFATYGKTDSNCTSENIDQKLNNSLYSLLYLSRSVLKYVKGHTDFYLVSDNAHEVTGDEKYIKPINASFLSMAKTIVQECPNFDFRSLDIDEMSDDKMYEVLTAKDKHTRIAIRDGKQYFEVLDSVDIGKYDMSNLQIEKEGVYLITGGTGGLGLEVAKYLKESGQCNICLMSRRTIPERNTWDQILLDGSDKKLIALINSVREIEENGSKVVLYSADVSDYESMKIAVSELQGKFGRINGVVHCAGVAGDGFLYNKSINDFNNVIYPKIKGSINIDMLLRKTNPDFIVFFSSMQTVFGGSGQGDYTAANTFLDEYARLLRKNGANAVTINWPGWSETGMAVDYQVADAMTMFKSLTNRKALTAFSSILEHNISNIIPGELSLEFLQRAYELIPIELSAGIERSLRRFNSKSQSNEQKKERNFNSEDLLILGKDADDYTDIEKTVAFIYAAVLDLNEIDIYESFNSMGGDSIIATEVLKILNEQYNDILNISDMFTYSCVMEMAEHITELLNSNSNSGSNQENYTDIMEKFESGDIDVDQMLEYFDEDKN